jgi:hypothetical protein
MLRMLAPDQYAACHFPVSEPQPAASAAEAR